VTLAYDCQHVLAVDNSRYRIPRRRERLSAVKVDDYKATRPARNPDVVVCEPMLGDDVRTACGAVLPVGDYRPLVVR
jgi:hypothetical protein